MNYIPDSLLSCAPLHTEASGVETPLIERPVVLCVGNDETLLSYRVEVLRMSGFDVISLCPAPRQLEHLARLCSQHRPAVCVACHTLTREQRIALAEQLRKECPSSKRLALTTGDLTAEEAASYDVLLDSLDGPAALIRVLVAQS